MPSKNDAPIVLVHGAWHGGWCWSTVTQALEARGRRAYAPTLSGCGHRSHALSRDISADTHVNDVASLVEMLDLHDVTLALHSYAGLLGPALLARLRPRLAVIAWIEAVVPSPGEAMLELTTAEAAARYRHSAEKDGDGWWMPPPAVTQFNLPSAWLAEAVERQLTPQPLRTFSEPVTVPQEDVKEFPGRYLMASDRNPQPYERYAAIARTAGWPVQSVKGGHLLMLTNSSAVVDFLA